MNKIKLFLKEKIKWIIAVIAFIIFLILLFLMKNKSIIVFDDVCYKYISLLISDNMTFFVKVITSLGSALPLILITVIFMLLPKEKKYGILIGINLIIVFLFNLLLKIIFLRPRPIDINLIEESGYSFPSGHAMISTAFYGFIIYLLWKSKFNKKIKWLYTIILSVLIVFICVTRVYLGVHYTSDVLAGFFMGIVYLIIFISNVSKYLQNKKSSK